MSNAKITRNEAVDTLWRKGILVWKLNSAQRKLYEMYYNTNYRIPVFKLTRRGGKSWTLLVLAIEQCIKVPGSIVHYACPTAVMATKIIIPTMRKLLEDCPKDLTPKYYKHDRAFDFPNGSKIQIEGVEEGNAERLRGTSTHLAIVDEAAFVDDLEYIVDSILLPQITTTNGKLILSSTPPKQTGHKFITKYQEKARANDAYMKLSVLEVLELIQNDPKHLKHLSKEIIEEIKETVGGEFSPAWRREYMVEDITDTSTSVLPEFNEELMKKIVKEVPRPLYYDPYTSMDPGLVDHTGVLFAYLDFEESRLVIEDEYFANGNEITSENIAQTILSKEKFLWTNELGITQKVYLRVSDNEPILLNDLRLLHGLNFIPAKKKDNKEAAINDLRIKLIHEKIIINPRCKNLIYQLRNATWAKNRITFTRSVEGGHFDLVDALIYLVRMVQWSKSPYPTHSYNKDTTFAGKNFDNLTTQQRQIKDIFTKKR
jgi:hypothetical protein